MKLVAFTVKNYRSITDAYKLPLGQRSILVGPNNEGKSNLLGGIALALTVISRGDVMPTGRILYRYALPRRGPHSYRWERDFPISLQASMPSGRSDFTLEFSLDARELAAFNSKTKSRLSTDLKVRVSLGSEDARLEVLIQGPSKKNLQEKIDVIADFIRQRIVVQHIPAIRPSELAVEVVEQMLEDELTLLENEPDYRRLLADLEAKQKPILRAISNELTNTVKSFVPEVSAVTVETASELRRAIRRSCTVRINDGTNTALELKGDGVKSLTAISLVRYVSQKALEGRNLVLAVEEPESHLHPRAIHRLREVLTEIAQSHQVIVTTHSPLLVDRASPSMNILVKGGRANPAKSLKQIRDVLGVELSDNLSTASLVLLVEGPEDVKVVGAWLPHMSDRVKRAMAQGSLVVDGLGGATNLGYKASLYRSLVCDVRVFVDNDDSARNSVENAVQKGILRSNEYVQATVLGMPNSEIEDLIVKSVYETRILDEYAVNLNHAAFNNSTKAWSERVRDCFVAQGKNWTKKLEGEIKAKVSDEASRLGVKSLESTRRGPIEALVAMLDKRLQAD